MINKNLIFDIGMHNGKDTKFYLDKGFKVISVEASPISCNSAQILFEKELSSGQLKIYNNAISDVEGIVTFSRYKGHDDWSSVIPNWNMSMYNADIETFDVEAINLDKIIEKEGVPYYIKIDIEGSDIICLRSLKNVKNLPLFISVELLSINNLKSEHKPDYLDILCTLKSLGYNKFQLIDQSKHEFTKCPNPSKEGKYVDVKFDGFSSGLFGNELPDNWMTIDEIILEYLLYIGKDVNFKVENQVVDFRSKIANIFYKPKVKIINSLDQNGWYDVHATF